MYNFGIGCETSLDCSRRSGQEIEGSEVLKSTTIVWADQSPGALDPWLVGSGNLEMIFFSRRSGNKPSGTAPALPQSRDLLPLKQPRSQNTKTPEEEGQADCCCS